MCIKGENTAPKDPGRRPKPKVARLALVLFVSLVALGVFAGVAGAVGPVVQFSAASYNYYENNASGYVILSLTSNATDWANVTWTTHDATAHAGTDYTSNTSTIAFTTETKAVVKVYIPDDSLRQGDRKFYVNLTSTDKGTFGTNRNVTVTIHDDEYYPLAGAVNWTDIGSVFTGFAGLVPDIVTMVLNFVPLLIIIAVVGFLLKFFNSVVGVIEGAVRIFKR